MQEKRNLDGFERREGQKNRYITKFGHNVVTPKEKSGLKRMYGILTIRDPIIVADASKEMIVKGAEKTGVGGREKKTNTLLSRAGKGWIKKGTEGRGKKVKKA